MAAILLLTGITGCGKEKEEPGIRVMTWNVYVGADINAILEETDPTLIPVRVAEAWAAVQNTNFAARARALASEIVRERPHLVGLQEISTISIQSPGDYLTGNLDEADEEVLNFLDLLRSELQEQGAGYNTVAITDGFNIELPMLVEPDSLWYDDIRIQDHDVLLARDGVQVGNTEENYFEANLEVSIGDSIVIVQRGWVSASVMIKGNEIYVVSAHLETSENSAAVQDSQAAELIEALSTVQQPIVLMGDFNSDADGSTTPVYGNLLAAGFVDAWLEMDGKGAGFTCCQLSDLTNTASMLDRRIDYILLSRGSGYEVLNITLAGADPEDRTLSGLWPSDHAGLSARIHLP